MNNLPIEKRVCTLEQAQELAELLESDAPESLWVWCESFNNTYRPYIKKSTCEITMAAKLPDYEKIRWLEVRGSWNAYTGDELGVILGKFHNLPNYPVGLTAQDKANIAILGLKDGWIKKEEFKYD